MTIIALLCHNLVISTWRGKLMEGSLKLGVALYGLCLSKQYSTLSSVWIRLCKIRKGFNWEFVVLNTKNLDWPVDVSEVYFEILYFIHSSTISFTLFERILKKFWRRSKGGDTCRGFSIPLVIIKLFCISKNAEPSRLQRTFSLRGWYEAVFSLEDDLRKKGANSSQ